MSLADRAPHRRCGSAQDPGETDGNVGPLATNRVTAEDGQTEIGEEGDRCFKVADGDADVLEFDGHALHAIESGRSTDLLDAARKFNLSDDDTLVLQQDYLQAAIQP